MPKLTGPQLRVLAAAIVTAFAAYLLAIIKAPIPLP
jgi:hypothetical protein